MKKLLGIDVGTTSLKAGLYNEKLDLLGSASVDYNLITSGDRVEFDAEEYVTILMRGMEKACAAGKPDSLSLDTQCETLILTDENGVPLRNAIVWLDNRAVGQAEKISWDFGKEKIYKITGQPEIAAAWPACKLLWVERRLRR